MAPSMRLSSVDPKALATIQCKVSRMASTASGWGYRESDLSIAQEGSTVILTTDDQKAPLTVTIENFTGTFDSSDYHFNSSVLSVI